jgi:hypothetical protein
MPSFILSNCFRVSAESLVELGVVMKIKYSAAESLAQLHRLEEGDVAKKLKYLL